MDDEVIILSVQTGEAVKSVGELRANITAYKEALEKAEIGSADYNNILIALQTNQAALKNAMHATTTDANAQAVSMEDVAKAATGAGNSYNALVRQMAMLDQEFRATEDVAKRDVLGSQIKNLNAQLKEMDEQRGKFGRNVGNYKSALDGMAGAFKATAGQAGSVIPKVQGVTAGFKAMSATPVIAILGLLANALSAVMKGLKSSDENADRMSKALAAFAPIGDAVSKTLQAMGKALAWIVEKIGGLLTSLGILGEASKERARIAEEENRLEDQQLETTMKNADAQREIAELRAQSVDKEKYTAAERLEFLRKAGEKEAEIAKRSYEDLKLQYEIQKAKNALTQSSAEEKKAEADAYAAMVQAETNYYNKLRENNSQISALRKEQRNDAASAASARIAAEKAIVDQQIALTRRGTDEMLALREKARKLDYDKAVSDAKKNIKDASARHKTLLLLEQAYETDIAKLRRTFAREQVAEELAAFTNAMNGYEQGSELYLTMAVELRQRTYETLSRLDDESDAEWEARRIAALQNLRKAEQDLLNAQINEGSLALKNEMNELREGSVEQFAAAVRLAQYEIDNLHQQIGESDEAFRARQLAAQNNYIKASEALLEAQNSDERQAIENKMNAYREGSFKYLAQAIELKKYELDTLHQLESESDAEFRARQLAAEKEYTDAKRALLFQRMDMMFDYAAGVADLAGSLADIYEANGEADEKSAKKAKALRVAESIINTISGAVAAFTGTIKSIPGPAGIALAAINSAAVLAAGYANVRKIQQQKVGSGGDGSGASIPAIATAPATPASIQQVRTITGATEEQRLNAMAGDQRVYLVYSDVEAAARSQRVKVQETSW